MANVAQVHIVVGDHFQVAQRVVPESLPNGLGPWIKSFLDDTRAKATVWPSADAVGEVIFVPPGSTDLISIHGVDGDCAPTYLVAVE